MIRVKVKSRNRYHRDSTTYNLLIRVTSYMWSNPYDRDPQLKVHEWKAKRYNICIRIKRKETIKTFMMTSNWKKIFGLHGLCKKISAL